jgi:hypothetical protein
MQNDKKIAQGLIEVMSAMSDNELSMISMHLTGQAFDVKPQSSNAEEMKNYIRSLPGLTKFLEKEGG